MRHGLRLAVAVALLWGVAAIGSAAEPKPPKKADTPSAASKSDAPTPAQLRVKMHRTLAALIEAQSADQPDQTQIDKLTKQLQNLRGKLWVGRPAAGPCPWGGPRMGQGRGGPGWGYGRGGPGKGRGPGYGRGAGYGSGGPGYGYGRGMGRQWGFIDKDQDGICDNFQKPQQRK